MKTLLIPLALLLAFTPVLRSARTIDTVEDARQTLVTTIADVLDILYERNGQSFEETEKRIEARAEESFSFEVIARRVLGRSWSDFSEEQQSLFTDKFQKLLMRTYARRFGEAGRPDLQYEEALQLNDRRAEIRSKASVDGNTYLVDYRLAKLPDLGWQVYDIIIEGVSLTGNYRKQFSSLMRTKSPADILELLDDKLNETES